MSKKRIEEYIPKAIKLIEEEKIAKEGKVPKEFNGYIASFGASMIQSGLLPAIAFYEDDNSKSQKERHKLMKVILRLISEGDECSRLLEYVIDNQDSKDSIKRRVKDGAIAVKLAIRTFKLIDSGDKNDEGE
ncbi:type III-B CRISPR module-associated protein Cmr5 [Halonatronum saccharophilum]|uniref:type III-B CRISPR module-associated protein Cmr5 n=1 Tax=Halonatronum saccharophilum TaxID=150060 RepID=UPI0004AE4690|nr:type III-B CRISPR module-associated protein Cmr5 [Halonatronum saccharophilum]